ncbi:hypothetical protein BGZ83_011568 [Gryganskiella cystojenkinii]|nr:hypothetical protein BGZ83_011568 [Gryganskiella cystojenkinii]
MSICLIVLYAMVATANIVGYLQQKVVHHSISGQAFVRLQEEAVETGTKAVTLQSQICWFQCMNNVNANLNMTGVAEWTSLPRTLGEVYVRPIWWAYVTNQLLMILTIAWASVYLFVPLLMHHRNRPDKVDRPIDGDMLAIGVWYLSCVMALTVGCTVLNVYYIFQKDQIFAEQAQALDLCIRVTLGPIFFLPAPSFLIRFYRDRFRKLSSMVNHKGSRGGRRWDSRGHGGTINCLDDEFDHEQRYGITTELGPGESYLPGERTIEVAASSAAAVSSTKDHNNNNHLNLQQSQKHVSSGSLYDRMRNFPSRNRDASMESSKVFNQDFDQDDRRDSYQNMTDDEQHFPTITELAKSRVRSEDVHQIPASHFSNDPVLEKSSTSSQDPKPLSALIPLSTEIKRPQPAWIALHQWNMNVTPGTPEAEDKRMELELVEKSTADPSREEVKEREIKGNSAADLIGTTGWELGGWGHVRETSETKQNGAAHPLEHPYPSASPPPLPKPPLPLLSSSRSKRQSRKASSLDFDNDSDLDNELLDVPVEELTGLQKQLAEHRSALLPVVLAMRDNIARGPPSVTYSSRDTDEEDEDEKTADNGRPAAKDQSVATMTGASFRPAADAPPIPPNPDVYREAAPLYPEKSHAPSTQTVQMQPWGKAAKISKTDAARAAAAVAVMSGKPADSAAEKSGIRKWLPGRKGAPGQHSEDRSVEYAQVTAAGPKKTVDAHPPVVLAAPPTVVSGTDNKSIKSNSSASSGPNAETATISTVATKSSKPKEGRLGMFKALGGHRHSEKVRTSQDIDVENMNDFDAKTDGVKTMIGPNAATAASKVPVSVEALALASVMANIEEVDESDKGLQYYYPDPYYSLTEFKKKSSILGSIDAKATTMDRSVSSGSQRPPFSENKLFKSSGVPGICTDSPLLDYTLNKNVRPLVSKLRGSDDDPSASATSFSSVSAAATTASSTGSTSSKSIPGLKKLTKAEALLQGSSSAMCTSKLISSPLPEPPKELMSSSSSILSRSSSGSKKFKIKSRNSRSKSDATGSTAPTTTTSSSSMHANERPSTDSILSTSSGLTALPITTTRKPSRPSAPVMPQLAQMSLSPPPRQGWARSKSFQGATSALTAALQSSSDKVPMPAVESNMSIDIKLANQHKSSGTSGSSSAKGNNDGPASSSSETRSSRESSHSPTTAASSSFSNTIHESLSCATSHPSSPPLSPPMTASSTTSTASSFTRMGGLKPRTSIEPKHGTLDRESSESTRLILGNKDRPAFSTAAMDLRRATNRHQRSVDNLASAYYYKRAAEMNSGAPGRNDTSEGATSSGGSGNGVMPPPSPSLAQSGFSYYGVGGTGGSDSGRNSPSPPLHQYHGSSSKDSASPTSSPSIAPTGPGLSAGVGSFYYQKQPQSGKSNLAYASTASSVHGVVMYPGGGPPATGTTGGTTVTPSLSSRSTAATAEEQHSRTSSITKNSSQWITTDDDPWTQAMVARAQQQQTKVSPPHGALDSNSGNVDRYSNYSQATQPDSRSMSPGPIMNPAGGIGGGGDSERGYGIGSSSYGLSHIQHGQGGSGGPPQAPNSTYNNHARAVSPPLSLSTAELHARPSINRAGSE